MRLQNLEEIQRQYDHMYFSPHPDDAALSCGGRIASQTRDGESVLVVTVFPPAGKEHDSLRDPALAVLLDCSRRREEDDRAMECLGADCLWLRFPDGISRYRFPLLRYGLRLRRRERRIYDDVHDEMGKIRRRARAKRLYFPLGIGQHKDHQILFEVGRTLCGQEEGDTIVSFYEDVPYVFLPKLLSLRLKWARLQTGAPLSGHGTAAGGGTLGEVLKTYSAIMNRPTLQLTSPPLKYAVLLPLAFFLFFAVHLLKLLPRGPSSGVVDEEIFDYSVVHNTKMEALVAYGSQVGVWFGDGRELLQAFANYSRDMGGAEDCFLERYWRTNNR